MSEDRMDSQHWSGTEEFKTFIERAERELMPKLRQSQATISFAPYDGETDIKFAVELGLSVMLDKPIVLLVRPGAKIPERLARVADDIVEISLDDPSRIQGAVMDAMDRLAERGLLK